METGKKRLPIGIENFEKLQTENFYYVDKTNLIKELLDHLAEVSLFTRPRRFGKSLNMSMLKNFFELGGNHAYFGNLEISKETALCETYMGKFPVILLIDEYDVPLAKAFERGYYDQMVILIRNLFEHALKSNDSLKFAVLTGCMRISKESIFTGLNNLKVLSVADVQFEEYFGFTDGEVEEMLEYYGLSDHYGKIKEWYDGYQFGNARVYCPWDVINYCDALRSDPEAEPKNYWSNTSGNEAVRRFIQESDSGTARREIEKLVAGEVITKEIRQELTYRDMYHSIENLWSVLFTTGYLTQRGRPQGDSFQLAIPNIEIRKIFTAQIMELFREDVPRNGETLKNFCEALKNGEPEQVEKLLGGYLRRTISIRDTFVKKRLKENFYHGILVGILGFWDTWGVSSNKESGDGYSDILLESDDGSLGIVLELKYADDGDLETACKKALEQIGSRRYEEELLDDGIARILKYGIAFYKKRCRVMLAAEKKWLLFTPLGVANNNTLRDAQKCCFRSISRCNSRDFRAFCPKITSRDCWGVNCNKK